MKIYLEVLIPVILILIFLFWKLWFAWSRKRLLKKYNPGEDKAKLAEDKRLKEIEIYNGKKNKTGRESIRGTSEVAGREPESQTSTASDVGLEQPQGRGLLPTATVDVAGKTSKGIGVSMPVRESKKRLTKRRGRRFG